MRLARKDSHSEAPLEAEAVAGHAQSAWHAQSAADVLAALESGPDGLSPREAKARLERFGPNRLAAARKQSEILRFLSHFNNLLIYVLIAASGLAASIGHLADAAVIMAVVLVNATIGYVQEGRAVPPRTSCPAIWCCSSRATASRPIYG